MGGRPPRFFNPRRSRLRPLVRLSRARRSEDGQSQRGGLASNARVARHQPEVRAERTRVALKDPQVERSQGDLLPFRPDEQNARRLRPGHPVLDGNEVVVRFEREQVGVHNVIISYDRVSKTIVPPSDGMMVIVKV